MSAHLTPEETDLLLERFDQTEPHLQRQIVAQLIANAAASRAAVAEAEESVAAAHRKKLIEEVNRVDKLAREEERERCRSVAVATINRMRGENESDLRSVRSQVEAAIRAQAEQPKEGT